MCIYARTHICWSHSANSHSCLSDVFVSLMLRIAAKMWNISIIPASHSKQTHRDSIFILSLFCFAVDFCLPKKFIRSQARDKKVKKKKDEMNSLDVCIMSCRSMIELSLLGTQTAIVAFYGKQSEFQEDVRVRCVNTFLPET